MALFRDSSFILAPSRTSSNGNSLDERQQIRDAPVLDVLLKSYPARRAQHMRPRLVRCNSVRVAPGLTPNRQPDTQEHGSYRKANPMHIGPSKPQPLKIAAQPIGRRRATTQRISCKQHRRSSALARPSLHLPESSPSMPIRARVPSRVLASMCRRRTSHWRASPEQPTHNFPRRMKPPAGVSIAVPGHGAYRASAGAMSRRQARCGRQSRAAAG